MHATMLESLTECIRPQLDAVERLFHEELRSDLSAVNTLVKHVSRFRGKMLRPCLVLLCGKATGELTHPHVVVATVVEMVHMATLVHDDVLDEAELRRKGATINHLKGNEAAVMLGDYLISHSFHLCSSLGSQMASREIGRTTNEVCEGELLQIDNRNNLNLTEETYFDIIGRKTAGVDGNLLPARARLSGADEVTARKLDTFGRALGTAFQIQDDLLDITGDTATVGKTLGIDAEKGKLTLPMIHFLRTAPAEHRALMRSLLIDPGPDRAERLRNLILPSGSLDYSRGVARHLATRARDQLGCLPDSDAKRTLEVMAEFVVSRAARIPGSRPSPSAITLRKVPPMPFVTRRDFLRVGSACAAAAALQFPKAATIAADTGERTLTATRVGDRPILRPDMMPPDDGQWSGNLNFPCLVRVPQWLPKPLGKYYLYFSAHHGSYIRLAYADQVVGPWKIYEPGTLRLEQVEKVNDAAQSPQRHVASPDVHFDEATKQVRLYFHYNLPKLGHSSSVAFSEDGLHFEPRAGRICGPYLRVWRRGEAYVGLDDSGMLLRSPDGVRPFEALSDCVKKVAGDPQRRVGFRHGGVLTIGEDSLLVCFSRVGDAPERLMYTRAELNGDAKNWTASKPEVLLEPEREYEGSAAPLEPSTIMGQTNVRQLRDPYLFRDGEETYLLYAVAGETGIGLARLSGLR